MTILPAMVKTSTDPVQAIKERIRASFVDLIPEEQWTKMVQDEVNWFTREPSGHSYNQPLASPLRVLIRKQLEDVFKDKLKQELSKPEYMEVFQPDPFHPDTPYPWQAAPMVKTIIREVLVDAWAKAQEAVVLDALKKLRNM